MDSLPRFAYPHYFAYILMMLAGSYTMVYLNGLSQVGQLVVHVDLIAHAEGRLSWLLRKIII